MSRKSRATYASGIKSCVIEPVVTYVEALLDFTPACGQAREDTLLHVRIEQVVYARFTYTAL
jgi:hypothetical protein